MSGVKEEWRDIPGYEGRYRVSSTGRVFSLPRQGTTGGVLRTSANKRGYASASFCNVRREVHSLVALAFLGPRPPGYQVRHLDGNPLNNHVENLAYGTRSENQRDKVRHGRDHNVVKTQCPRGHPYDLLNTQVYQGRRYCRTCAGWSGYSATRPSSQNGE